MDKLKELLDKYINEGLKKIVISNARRKDGASKLQVRPILVKGELVYQITRTEGQKELHQNFDKESVVAYLVCQIEENFKQLQLEAREASVSALVSKKGKVTIKVKENKGRAKEAYTPMLSHNRTKNYLLKEGVSVPWLVDLGVMSQDGKVKNARYDKFKQLNRFLEFIEDVLPKLPKDREVQIIDFGCGKSYLTFAMYYYLKELKGYPVRIIGLDLKKDVIEKCNGLAVKYGYEKLAFYTGDIASYEGVDQVDMVVTLHACDTATDFALEKAVRWGAKVILSVPCCQHELNGQMENELLEPVLQYGIIRERMAALFTDALRARILECCGYRVQILEFIDMEHTPKNLLIRAVKQGGPRKDREELQAVLDFLHAEPTLYRLLMEQDD